MAPRDGTLSSWKRVSSPRSNLFYKNCKRSGVNRSPQPPVERLIPFFGLFKEVRSLGRFQVPPVLPTRSQERTRGPLPWR